MSVFLRERWELVALGAVMVLGGELRFYGLGIQSLWSDELASWYFGQSDGVLQVVRNVREDIHPPGYFLMLHFAQRVFGDAEWALRLPSAVAGWLSIPAIYLLGRRLYAGREGLFAALVLAVSWTGLYFSQETRSYAALILLSTVTTFLWWGMVLGLRHGRGLPRAEAVLYVVCAVLCAYLHYFGALLVFLQGVGLLALAPRSFPRLVLVYAPISLAYALWVPGMAYQMRNSTAQGAWIGDTSLSIFPSYVEFLFGRSTVLALVATALIVLALSLALSRVFLRDAEKPVLPDLVLLGSFVGPFVAGYALSQFSVQLLTHKNLLVSLPAAYLLVARGIAGLLPNGAAGDVLRWSLALGFAAAGLFNVLFAMDYYTSPNKEQLRAATSFIRANETPKTLLVRCDIDDRLDYYLNDGAPGERRDTDACTGEDFPAVMDRVRRGGYEEVYYFMSHKQPTPRLVSRLRAEFDLVRYQPFYRSWVAVFRVDGNAGGASRDRTADRG